MNDMAYTIELKRPIDEIVTQLEAKTPAHNFRVLAVHDVQNTLAEKGFEINPLKIYEVCNAGFAYKAISL